MLAVGARGCSWLQRQRWNLVAPSNPIAYLLLLLFAGTLVCLVFGVTPIFGAFLAGIAVSADRSAAFVRARESIQSFSFAFFVPVYFAIVGEQLDLLRHLDLVFLGWFALLACTVKAGSVFVGARLAGESGRGAWNLAVATNARGGPCIVLASVTFGAGLISPEFYSALVMLAIITSMIAGALLGRVVRSGQPLRDEPRRRRAGSVADRSPSGRREPRTSPL
jgi:Kef-type K+ transport system membrane component KefB